MHTKRFRWVNAVFILGVIFCGIQWHHYNSDINVRKITVYSIAGHTAVDFFDKGSVCFIADSLLTRDQQKIDFHITGNRIKSGARNIRLGPMIQQSLNGCSLTVWNKKSVLQIYDPSFSIPEELRVDFVIVSNNAVTNVGGLLKQIDAKNIILDSSNSRYNVSKLVGNSSIPAEIHAVALQGAFELKI